MGEDIKTEKKSRLTLLLLDLVPHVVRRDSMTVGVVVLEPGGKFADAQFTRDWKRLQCFAPNLELEVFEDLKSEIRGHLDELRGREEASQFLENRFGSLFDIGAVKALEAEDPVAEMRVLERAYLAPMERVERSKQVGRWAIIGQMEGAFLEAGVLKDLQRDLDMREFTGENDPFSVDFGFRIGKSLKMFQALALNMSRDPAVTLAFRCLKIRDRMWNRGETAHMTAIVAAEALQRNEVHSGIAMLREAEVEVRSVTEVGEIAERVRRELRP